MDLNPLDFDLPKHRSSAIKVVGVGGGGSNAVNYMKNQGIRGVDFIICNTDAQALAHSPVETKIQLGATLTEGLGAGANPEVGEQAALESYTEIQAALGSQTKMVFITAGMGGGTGTGAAPIIAKASREMGILTVGIVTAPFGFEGNMRLRQAEQGIERLREHVDSLIVINNNKLREVYGNLGFKQGFMKADEVLSTAARGIAEVITHHYSVNIDLRDAKTVLHNSGTAIMGSAKAAGSTRALSSVRNALDSPLLNDNHIEGARYVLLLIVSGSGEHEVTLDEIGEINDFIQEQAGRQVDIIMGIGEDPHLADALQVTVIATGFSATNPIGTVNPAEPEKVVYELRPDTTPGSQFGLFDQPVQSLHPLDHHVDTSADLAAATEEPISHVLDNQEDESAFPMASAEPWDVEEPLVAEATSAAHEEAPFAAPAMEATEAEESSPTMTWTLDWNDEPARPAKSVGLDELLAFEASLRGEELTPAPEEAEAFLDDSIAFAPEVTEIEPIEMEAAPVAFELEPSSAESAAEEFAPMEQPLAPQYETPAAPTFHAAPERRNPEVSLEVRSTTATAFAPAAPQIDPDRDSLEETMRRMAQERRAYLQAYSHRFGQNQARMQQSDMDRPAFERQGWDLDASARYSQEQTLGDHMVRGTKTDIEFRPNNSFLHDNVD